MVKTMRAVAVYEDKSVKLVYDVPVPEIGEYEALIKIKACGFCNGTDFHVINGTMSEVDGFPAILGHEAAGEAVELGSKVRYIQVGDRFFRPSQRPLGNYL